MDERAHEYVDVVVVGAGISGIGAGYHLQTMCPNRSYVILEGRRDIGGTWDLFRYPGVRSDSDMHTLGYRFKPWTAAKAIADGPSIMAYLRETVAEFGIDRHIRFGHSVRRADWSSEDATWTVSAVRQTAEGAIEPVTITCNYLFMCAGYYSYAAPYDAEIPGLDRFEGRVVHPQSWPDDLDHAGERVVVIGSGATAMTLVPAMAATAGHVTMLQRSPTYVVARPDEDAIAKVKADPPDVILMDLKMPKLNGIHTTRRITTAFPAIKIIILTTYDGDEWVFDAIRAGASGYLLKDSSGEDIVAAIRDGMNGRTHLDPQIASKILSEFNRLDQKPVQAKANDPVLESLTERELSILQLMAQGQTNQEIADALFLAPGTVKNNVSTILGKLHANDRTQAVLTALRRGIVDL